MVGLSLIALNPIIGITASAEDFTIIVLPDTQHYSSSYPATFSAQTQWIVDNKDNFNIVYVVHEGDIVDTASSSTQWERADAAMSLLEDPTTTGLDDGIPYGVVPGNHDQPTNSPGYYNTYFGVSRFSGRGYYGGSFDSDNDDNYTLFSAAGIDFMVINLNYDTSPDIVVLNWAGGLLETYSNRLAIVVSHYLLNMDGSFGSQGQAIYDALKDNPNLFLMLCGHIQGEAMRVEEYNDNTVHIVLADYQDLSDGGDGWLRIMEFSPANDEITVKTYSPTLDQYGADTVMGYNTTSQEFTISYDFGLNTPFADRGGGGGICFIGTTVYRSPMAEEVKVLEKFRDEYLLTNALGRTFVSAYYKYSPPLADWIAKHPTMRKIVRIGLYPIVGLSKWFVGENPFN